MSPKLHWIVVISDLYCCTVPYSTFRFVCCTVCIPCFTVRVYCVTKSGVWPRSHLKPWRASHSNDEIMKGRLSVEGRQHPFAGLAPQVKVVSDHSSPGSSFSNQFRFVVNHVSTYRVPNRESSVTVRFLMITNWFASFSCIYPFAL